MLLADYIAVMNRRPHGPLGPLGPLVAYRIEAPLIRSPRPASPAPPAPPPRRREAPAARPVGYADGSPHLLCRVCLEPAHLVAGTLMCGPCAAEVRWRVALARQGLKVVS